MRVLFAAALAVLFAAPSLAQTPLFTPLDGTQRLALSPSQSHYLGALESERGIEAVDLVVANVRQLDAKATLELALPDVTVTLETISATPRPTGHLSWVGRAAPGSGSSAWAVLVERDGLITGEVHTGGYVYPVRPLTGGLHAVARKSMADYQAHPDTYEAFVETHRERIAAEREAERTVLRAQPRRAGVVTTVDVIVPYTTNVSAAYADPFALAQSFVDVTNVAYDNSGLPDLDIRLVNAYETPFASSGSLETDLTNITGTSDGTSDEVHTLRTAYGADLVALISGTNTSGVCGIAYVNSSSSTGFSANSAGCGALTFAHEVGHNFGAAHDPITGGVVAYSYGQGYTNQAGDWGTIMAYDTACDDDGTPGAPPYSAFCEIIPYFSNPDISYTDTSAPISSGPTGNATTADNARVHEERATTVAAFRTEGTPPELAYSPSTLFQTLATDATSTQTLTIENTAGATSTPLNWSASLSNATGPSGSRTAPGRWKVSATPLTSLPTARTIAQRAASSVVDCVDGDQIAQSTGSTSLSTSSGGTEYGQSFTATCTGRIASLSFVVDYNAAPNEAWSATLRFYAGEGTGGSQLTSGSFSWTNGPAGATLLTLTLGTPLDISQGNVYTWFLDMTAGSSATWTNTSNPYAGGTLYTTSNGAPGSASSVSGSDARFTANLLAPTTPSITWVSLAPTSGALDGGDSENVTVSFDATGLADGVYTADLTLTTTDPDASSVTIPVQLTVADLVAYAFDDGFGWRLLSPPGDATTVQTIAAQNLVQGVTGSYETFDDNLYTGYTGAAWSPASATTDALASGRGFLWYLFDQDIDTEPGNPNNGTSVLLPMTLEAAGNEPSGDVDVSVHGAGFDLLGNPYADVLDVSGIAGWTGAGHLTSFVGQVYTCTPDASPTVECVGSYETTTSLGDAVPVWHGVFFETGTAGTLTIPISAKGLPASRTSAPRLVALELAPATGGAIDRAATLVFRDGANAAWDGWDVEKLAPLDNPSVTLAFEGDRDGATVLKAQESRPYEAESFEVPLSVASQGAGSEMVLTWPRLENLPSDWTLTLIDRQTGSEVDLRQLDRYAFSVAESAGREGFQPGAKLQRSAGAARFTLSVQTSKSVGTETETASVLALDAPRPNPVGSQATVTFSLAEAGPARLSVVDLLGREVAVLAEGTRPAGPGLATWQPDGLAAGVYLLRLEAAGTVLTRRAVVTR